MLKSIDKKAENYWKKSNILLMDYQKYIFKKEDKNKFKLTFIDLLYISNFKGGNSNIKMSEKSVNSVLIAYSKCFVKLYKLYGEKSLREFKDDEVEELKNVILSIMTNLIEKHPISGFKYSYLSALLHAHFPNLIPILDRRVLINLDLVTEKDLTTSKQVKNIQNFFGELIDKHRNILIQNKLKNIRQIDYESFILKLPKNSKI